MTVDWRDWEMVAKPQSDFARIFGAKPTYKYVRKATYRGGSGSRLHHIENLTRAEAAHFLLHDRYGRQLRRDFPNIPFDELAAHLCEASLRTEKREAPMSGNMELIVKSETGMHAFCKGLVARDIAYPHAEFDTKVLAPYARNRHPLLHVGNAIAKVLAEEPPVAAAYSAVHSAYHPAYAVAKAAVVDDDDDEDEDEDERDDGGEDAYERLQELAREERRRRPELSAEKAFTKNLH